MFEWYINHKYSFDNGLSKGFLMVFGHFLLERHTKSITYLHGFPTFFVRFVLKLYIHWVDIMIGIIFE